MKPARNKVTPAELQQRLSTRLDQTAAASQPLASALRSIIRLSIRDVDFYDRNPRTVANRKLVEIMDSIEARGLDNILTITKRPKTHRYVVARGGNTRLLALHKLYEKTSDSKYLEQDFEVIPYTSEFELLIAHVSENENRDDLQFWDKARSLMNLKADLELADGQAVSYRALAATLKDNGVTVSPPFLTDAKWAVDNLSNLGAAAIALKHQHVQKFLKPTWAKFEALSPKLSLAADTLAEQVMLPALEMARIQYEERAEFNIDDLVDGLYSRLGALLELNRLEVNRLLAVSELNPEMSGQELLSASRQQTQQPLMPSDTLASAGQASGQSSSGADSSLESDAQEQPGDHNQLPSQVRTQTKARDGLRIVKGPPANTLPTHSSGSQDEPVVQRTAHDPRSAAATSVSKQPSVEDGSETSLVAFLQTVATFADACGIGECVRSTDALPLGFMVEPPAMKADEPALDTQAAQGNKRDIHRYYGWWWLVSLSLQNTPAGLVVVPEGNFAALVADDAKWEQACETELGEPIYADRLYKIVATMMDPADQLGPLYLSVISAVRAVRVALPERFTAEFWTTRGVDHRLAEEQ